MVQNSKWLEGSSPGDLASRAGRHALKARLELVWHYFPLAADEAHTDAETVHQLRISTRRAEAALRSYRPFLPPRRAKWFDKQLKRIRQAAGTIRDADVMLTRLSGQMEDRPDPAWKALLKKLRLERREAQAPLVELQHKLARKDFPHRAARLVKRVRLRETELGNEPTFGEVARDVLQHLAAEFLSAGESELADIAALHQFRIRGKRLLYALELFAAAFDARLRTDVYPLVEQVQEQLGHINDHATAIDRFRGWLDAWQDPVVSGPLTELIAGEERALATSREQFFAWWTPDRLDDLRRRFEDLLTSPIVGRVA